MYFGTNSGVSIYYGNGFKNFSEVKGKKIGIINQIVGNAEDSIYVVASTIPFFYRLQEQQLEKYMVDAPTYMYSMLYDEGRFLVCADNGLFVFANQKFKKVELQTKDTIKFISKIISCNKDLWLIGRLGGSMELVNKKTLQTTAISPKLTVTQFYKDGQDNIWIATKDKGILLLSADAIVNNQLQLSAIPKELDFLADSEVNDITGDKEGNIYFATLDKGLVKRYVNNTIEIINTQNGLSSLNVRTAFVDREGNLWIGTNMGIDKLSIHKLDIFNDRFGLQSNICYDAALYKNRYLITPNNLGFSVIDHQTRRITNFPLRVSGENYPFKVHIIGDIIYMLSKNKIAIVNKKFDPLYPFEKEIIFPGRINTMTNDNNGNLLVGGAEGIWKIVQNKPIRIINEPDVRTIMTDENNLLWIGKYDNGFVGYKLDEKGVPLQPVQPVASWKTDYFQDHSRILIRGNNQSIWYGTRFSGLYQLQYTDSIQVLRKFNAQNGLSSDFVQSLLLDQEGNILVGTADGLDIINGNNNYSTSIGVHKKFNFSSKINQLRISDNGKLWMATDDGILNLEMRNLQMVNNFKSSVYLTAIKVKGIPTSFAALEIKKFQYNQNSFSFFFSTNSYVNENNILYSWQLKGGSDSSWTEPMHTNTAGFNDLKPGKYTFQVRSIDGATKMPISSTSFTFIIQKPFWLQIWFLLLMGLLLLFILYRLIKFREKNIAQKEAQKTELQKIKAISYRHQLEIEQVINYFATSIHQNETVETMLWDVTKNCISKLGFEDCVIYLLDHNSNKLVQKAAWGNKISETNHIFNAIEITPGEGIVGAVAKTGKPLIIADTATDPRYIQDDANRLSEIAVPIISNGNIIGVIDSEHPNRNFYTDRHLQILTTIASLCADKMEKITAEQMTREKELEVLHLQKDLATSQLTTLRAQMNPHFIFNALNSIQQYILLGNVDEANRYLAKFSKLQREILNNSSHQFLLLENEIELLTLYLELEQLRFDKNFEYQITVDPEIDTSEVKVPTMVIQPFIENAIWHGLATKPGEKKLQISFSTDTPDMLLCRITDNGIGRYAADLLKGPTTKNSHISKGQGLVEDRLKILQNQYKKEFRAVVQDVYNEKQEVAGTQVTLFLYIGD